MIRFWLFSTLSCDVLVEVHDLQFSTLIWDRLQQRFMSANLARSMELKRLLSTIQKTENQTMDSYLREIKMIADSLVAISSPVPLHDLIEYTLIGLSGSGDYDSLSTAITHFPGQLTFDDLRPKLLLQDQRFRVLNPVPSLQHQAFGAQTFGSVTTSVNSSSGNANSTSAPQSSNNNNNNRNRNKNGRVGRNNRKRG